MNGSIIPAYTINTLITKFPIVGDIVTAGSPEDGLIGAKFKVEKIDGDKKINCPVLALWGSGQSQHPGWPSMHLDVVKEWKKCAHDVRGWGIDCGHFMPEEAPEATFAAIIDFLA